MTYAKEVLGRNKILRLIFCLFVCWGFLTTKQGIWGIWVPWLGIELIPSAMGAWSLNHWTTREVPKAYICIFKNREVQVNLWIKMKEIKWWRSEMGIKQGVHSGVGLSEFLRGGLKQESSYFFWRENSLRGARGEHLIRTVLQESLLFWEAGWVEERLNLGWGLNLE